LVEIKSLYNSYKITEANNLVDQLKLEEDKNEHRDCLNRVTLWRIKAYYNIGDYKNSLELVDAAVAKI